ncbi:MAG: hypothetical protein ABS81_22775 [Pseudonocardia sp. SCN 72-86]|nr:MAG: hypothetical protein ABS81_22775 [Pseudonocardia sp. SCN 72-86]
MRAAPSVRTGPAQGAGGAQLLALRASTRLAIDDLRLAAWLRWMTPLLAALSRALAAARST